MAKGTTAQKIVYFIIVIIIMMFIASYTPATFLVLVIGFGIYGIYSTISLVLDDYFFDLE